MARRLPPRDNRGRFTRTGIPLWFGILVAVVIVWTILR